MPKKQATPAATPALDDAFIAKVHAGIWGTWGILHHDLMACVEEMAEAEGKRAKPLTNAEALETVLDANYMSTNGFREEEKLIDAAIKAHGYPKVERFLRKHFHLA